MPNGNGKPTAVAQQGDWADDILKSPVATAAPGAPGATRDWADDLLNPPVKAPESALVPSLGDRTEEAIGSLIPQWMTGPLAAAKKYAVDPFEKMAKAGAEAGGGAAEALAAAPLETLGAGGRQALNLPPSLEAPEKIEAAERQLEQRHPIITGATRGVGEFAGGMAADPRMWALGLGEVGSIALRKLISAGFSAQMLYGAAKQVPEIDKAIRAGDSESAAEMITQATLGAGMGALAGTHAVFGKGTPPADELAVEPKPTQPALPAGRELPALPPATIGGEPIRTYIPSRFETEPNALPIPLPERMGESPITAPGVTHALPAPEPPHPLDEFNTYIPTRMETHSESPIQLPSGGIRLPGVTRALPPFRGTEEESFLRGGSTPVPRMSPFGFRSSAGPLERTPEGRVPDAAPRPPTDLTTLDRNSLPSQLVPPDQLTFEHDTHPQRAEGRVEERKADIQSGKEPRVTGVQLPNGQISVAKGHQTGWAAQEEGVPVRATILPMSLAEKDAAEVKSHEFPSNDVPVPAKMLADSAEDRARTDPASERAYIEASKKEGTGQEAAPIAQGATPIAHTAGDWVENLLASKSPEERAAAESVTPREPGIAAPNASGESAASLEAQNRLAGEKAKGIGRFVVDTRSGKERPLQGTDAVDYKVKPYEMSFKRDNTGRVEIIDRGEKAVGSPRQYAPMNEKKAADINAAFAQEAQRRAEELQKKAPKEGPSPSAEPDIPESRARRIALGQDLHSNPIAAVANLWSDLVAKPAIDKLNDLVNIGLGKMEAAVPSIQAKRLFRSEAKFLPENYRQLRQFSLRNPIREARTTAISLGERLSKDLSQRTQQILMSVVKGDIDPAQLRIVRSTPRLQDALEAAKEARVRLDSAGLKAVMQGLLKDETYFKNVGKYVPRLYRRYEIDYDKMMNVTGERKPNRLDLDRFRRREDIPPEIRYELGEIKEAAYPVARGLADIESDAAYADFFNKVAANKEWTSDEPKPGYKLVDPQGRDWTQLPITNKLGSLSGKYLHPDIYNDVNEMVKIRSEMTKLFGSLMGRYKRVRIIWSPASFVWHNLSRSFLNWYELGLKNPVTYGKALLDLSKKGPMYQEALKQGAIQEHQGMDPDIFDTMLDSWNKSQGGAMRRLMEMGAHTMATLKSKEQGAIFKAAREFQPLRAVSGGKMDRVVQFYNSLDQWMKLSGYMHLRETQPEMDKFEAADHARRATIDYTDVPKMIDTARRYFLPFVTFPSRAIPQAITATLRSPWRALLLYGLISGIQSESRKALGISATDDERNRRLSEPKGVPGEGLDQTVFGLPRYILMPWKDSSNRFQYLDLNHLVHWTGVGNPPAPGVTPFGSEAFGGPLALPGQIMEREIYGNPLMSSVGDVLANRDPYTGKQLYGPGEEYKTAAGALAGRTWKTATPSLFPGNYSFEKLKEGVEGRPDYFGRPSPLPEDLLSTFAGLNIRPEDPTFEAMFRNKEFKDAMEDIRKSMYSTEANARLSETERQSKLKELMARQNQLISRYQRLYAGPEAAQ